LERRGCDIYAYFDGDQENAAPADALRLQEYLARRSRTAAHSHPSKLLTL
jgi:uncharacterized protein YecE (DUF72 family)